MFRNSFNKILSTFLNGTEKWYLGNLEKLIGRRFNPTEPTPIEIFIREGDTLSINSTKLCFQNQNWILNFFSVLIVFLFFTVWDWDWNRVIIFTIVSSQLRSSWETPDQRWWVAQKGAKYYLIAQKKFHRYIGRMVIR